jgi:phage major head subunit gpT-like protein
MQIDMFTVMMRSEFLKGMQAVPAREPKYKDFTTIVPSTARIENYAWMTPSPGIQRYLGHRRYATLDQIKYTVPNLEFSSEITVALRDLEDDQIGGYPLRFNELGLKAEAHPSRYVLQTLALGETTGCFDGTNFFATSHNQGSGNNPIGITNFTGGLNDLAYTAQGSSDGLTYNAVFMLHYNAIKPLGYQRRKGPDLRTNAGTPQSFEAKQVNYWVDLEAAAFFGYWWDAILVKITNTPNLTDIFTIIDVAIKQFLSFTLPTGLPSDPALYIHQDIEFTKEVGTIVCSNGLWALLNHGLNEERIGVSVAGSTSGFTNNIYRGAFGLVASGYLNGTGN